jgi:hypothetical protein
MDQEILFCSVPSLAIYHNTTISISLPIFLVVIRSLPNSHSFTFFGLVNASYTLSREALSFRVEVFSAI